MAKIPSFLKNKFILASVLFVIFTLFLDENDIFTMISHKQKLVELEIKKAEFQEKLDETRYTLEQLNYLSEVERFAREEKFFKKDDEDVFVIFYE
ncbi:MAG: hypothetical protein QNK23_09895 [Crocinitomicaceae bacterium]|nr:hypothetical protein [Crocinitomicaceae bacterium]